MRILVFLLLLPLLSAAQEITTISGRVLRGISAGRSGRVEVLINDIAFGGQLKYFGDIDKDGSFSVSFPKVQPQDVMLIYNNEMALIFIHPGDQLHVSIGESGLKELSFSGKGADDNSVFQSYQQALQKFWTESLGGGVTGRSRKLQEMEDKASEEEIKQYLQERYTRDSMFSESYLRDHPASPLISSWIRYDLEYEYADNLMRYAWIHPSGNKDARYTPSAGYYGFVSRFPLNRPEAMICSAYGYYLHEYSNYLVRTTKVKNNPTREQIAEAINRDSKTLSVAEKEKFRLFMNPAKEVSQEELTWADKVINEHLSIYDELEKKVNGGVRPDPLARVNGLSRDIIWAQQLFLLIEAKHFDRAKVLLDENAGRIATPFIRSQLEDHYKNRASAFNSATLPAGANLNKLELKPEESFLAALLKIYKGKVIYMDFWATWCGPCREEMPGSAALREKLAGKEVVFLYIGVESQENVWKKTIAELGIAGEHYLANPRDFGFLKERFGITGIPHYVIVDKNGRIVDGKAQSPGNPETKKMLEALL